MKVYDGATWITATAAGTSAMSRYRYVATAGQTTFSGADANSLTLSYTSGNIVVNRNGSTLEPAEYTASNGTSIVLAVAAAAGDVVDVVAFKSFTVADTYSQAQADALLANKQPLNSNLTTYAATGIGFRNRIINGSMAVNQYGTVPSGLGYPVDRFNTYGTQAGKISTGQNLNSIAPPVGFQSYVGVQSSSSFTPASSDFFGFGQAIEANNISDFNFGTANAISVTLSFWVRSSLTGTFGGSFINYAATRSYPFTFAINSANTWEQKSITIAGDTGGTWVLSGNGGGCKVLFDLGSGASLRGPANTWASTFYNGVTGAQSLVGTSGATFYITGVQLEAGTVASPFERRDYGRELMMCQRYFQKFGGTSAFCSAGLMNSSLARMWYSFPVVMRATPTASNNFTGYGSGSTQVQIFVNGTLSNSSFAVGHDFMSAYATSWTISTLSGTAGTAGSLDMGSSAFISVNAEL